MVSFPAIGQYAVHGFFILSGYLMTFILSGSYGYSLGGLRSFAINRFLRLYPPYWFILALSAIMILFFGNSVRSFHPAVFLPDTWLSLLQNLSLVYLDWFPMSEAPRISPPTWALTVELLFYLLIALGLSKTPKTTAVWLAISAMFMVSTHIFDLGHRYRYTFVLSGSLPFALGAAIFHWENELKQVAKKFANLPSVAFLYLLFGINSLAAAGVIYFKLPPALTDITMYLNLAINFCLIVLLIMKPPLPFGLDLDKKIGAYSYPIYLCHWQCGFLAVTLLGEGFERGPSLQGGVVLSVTLVFSFLVSYAVVRFIDEPIEKFRKKVKQRAAISKMTA